MRCMGSSLMVPKVLSVLWVLGAPMAAAQAVEKQHVLTITAPDIDGGILAEITWDNGALLLQGVMANPDGTLLRGLTCSDWTSAATDVAAQVGHSDGFGAGQSTTGTNSSWNSAHANASCANTAPRGGAGRIYCFGR